MKTHTFTLLNYDDDVRDTLDADTEPTLADYATYITSYIATNMRLVRIDYTAYPDFEPTVTIAYEPTDPDHIAILRDFDHILDEFARTDDPDFDAYLNAQPPYDDER